MRRLRPSPDRPQQGLALVVALWVSLLLAAMASAFVLDTRSDAQISLNVVDAAQARALADGGVYLAIADLLADRSAQRWPHDGRPLPVALPDGALEVSIQDEAGKVDLNAAPDELLLGLFAAVGIDGADADRLLDAIADWRDPDTLRRLNGAEDADYRAAGLSYGAKNAPFAHVDELRMVLGVTPDIYRRLRPLVTVYSGQARIDPDTAPPGVLLALPGMSRELVSQVVAARAELTGGAAREQLAGVAGTGLLGRSRGRVFTVRAAATTESGARFLREAVVGLRGRGDANYVLRAWRQGVEGLDGFGRQDGDDRG